jgi:hypothetical protein
VRNVTISMDEVLLARAREHAQKHGTTFNQLVRDLVAKELAPDPGARTRAAFELAIQIARRSENGPLSREEAHSRG